jgi:hypothetical protein
MKSRVFRAVGVGAALLIPVAGMVVLGAGVAGATTLTATSTAAFGVTTILGHITLVGVTVNLTTGTAVAWSSATGRPVSTSAHLKANIVAKQTTSKIVSGATVTLVATGGTTGENNCKITLKVPVTLNKTAAHTIWFGSTPRLTSSQTTVTGCATPTVDSFIHGEITNTKINVTETK